MSGEKILDDLLRLLAKEPDFIMPNVLREKALTIGIINQVGFNDAVERLLTEGYIDNQKLPIAYKINEKGKRFVFKNGGYSGAKTRKIIQIGINVANFLIAVAALVVAIIAVCKEQ
ncbi:MAG TPA: hypothetical protein VI731_09165 [Bacteroidia bacterium]|nr:hypothetical protein [Bacteroidia bacterium]